MCPWLVQKQQWQCVVYEVSVRYVLECLGCDQCEHVPALPVQLYVRVWERVLCVQAGLHRRRRGCMHRVCGGEVQANEREWRVSSLSRKLKLERRERYMHV